MRKILAVVAAALLAVGVFGGAVAAVAASEPAKAYGGCVSKSTGYLRVLERNNLAKSALGKCKSTERRITLPSTSGLIKGDRGASAYELWRDIKLADGTQPNKAKTLADFLVAIKGDTGAQGPKGDAGAQGPKGDPGRGFNSAPFKMTFTGNGPWTCSWQAETETLACVTPTS